jgi:4,5:9,10-diseco-3-hydroxy-5,9,17-trioxoandrosta-1(10),2-diene-4-oate hydrolase
VRHFRAGADGDASFREWFSDYSSKILVTPEAAAHRQAIVDAGYETAPRLVEAWESFRRPEADLRPIIPRVTMPVLFAWASKDELVSWSRNKDSIEAFPNRRIRQFPAGHSPFLETPTEFAAEAAAFLKTLP